MVALLVLPGPASVLRAQETGLVAVLEVIEPGVQMQRLGDSVWASIHMESIVGAGDVIRTDRTGRARITFFEDGTFTELDPSTEYRIVEFRGSSERFDLSVEILAGIALQQFARLLDPASSYKVMTPGMAMTVRGTDFAVRVEDTGRSALLTYDGLVEAAAGGQAKDIDPGFGVRSAGQLSQVVPATTFEELDAALDGCPGTFETEADVRLNVRVGPGLDYGRVGSIDPQEVALLLGIDESGEWYRIPWNNGYGWVSAAPVSVDTCDALRRYAPEDADLVENVGLYTTTGEVAELGVLARIVAQKPNINFRAGPGTGYTVMSLLENGSEVRIIGRNDAATWLQILLPDGRVGWAATFLVESPLDVAQYRVIPIETLETVPPGAATEEAPADGAADG
jgi:uncharacterized protein YraI